MYYGIGVRMTICNFKCKSNAVSCIDKAIYHVTQRVNAVVPISEYHQLLNN